ncbi:hypothetical protein BpHYR1_008182 [Brachionus plicatilis]|uniref:Uncharacterized protein n=1 Tax=Brachionus plicatilis TaxID=10195 RepID=A0A3M7Q6X8_BRAPC|nr:hypothetical protein BpHYR1_008182 [Brachionus plicatilis]
METKSPDLIISFNYYNINDNKLNDNRASLSPQISMRSIAGEDFNYKNCDKRVKLFSISSKKLPLIK